jgi:hypothetical protein
MHRKLLISATLCIALSDYSYATVNVGSNSHATHKSGHTIMATGCTQDLGAAVLNLNNIRCRIMDEGDMWWNPGTGCNVYFAPANGIVSAQFAGSLWLGGYDAGNELKEAAMTYRQNGEDFWAGPIDTCTGGISLTECAYWDKMFYCTEEEVATYHNNYPHGEPLNNEPLDIKNWPGSGNAAYCESQNLAPYISVSGLGVYSPQAGDYPAFDLTGDGNCQNELYGDACYWWVINDVGNIHTETGSVPIGVEIRCQAFAFQTNDAINNMTFYHYQIINRSTFALYHTYFGFWDDFDLGNGNDNYTGCDVSRNMGYGYNGLPYDPDGSGDFACEPGYHGDPAAVGVVFFQGPKADPGDTNCYTKNGLIGMARFCYYNNDFTVTGNPTNQTSYYDYLTGFWLDGTPMTYGGTGYGGTVPCHYMFPYTPAGALGAGSAKNTDPAGCGTNGIVQNSEWDEVHPTGAGSTPNPTGDRRFIESSGPFTLQPGAVNYVIVGCVWDQPGTNGLGNLYPIGLIQGDADLAQGLFNNCFKVVNGPDAPDVTTQALNQEIILTLSNAPTSNNYKEHYAEKLSVIPSQFAKGRDTDYVFQGYIIYQLLDSSVTASELLDPTVARQVVQCDVKDSISQIVNYVFSSTYNANIPTLEVSGANKGISHSFDIKSDLFQEDGEANLVNDRPYYYMVIAYAYNDYFTYNPNGPDTNLTYGQKLPFLQGRRNIQVYTVYPTIVNAENYGTVQNSAYGSGVPITRLEGHGNGTNTIELDQNSINYILANDSMAHPSYVAGEGPITVKVVDPLNVVAGNFIVKFTDTGSAGVNSATTWELINQTTGEVDHSDTSIGYQYEQVFPQYGISISIVNVPFPGGGNQEVVDSSCSLTFANPNQNWLSYVGSVSPAVNLQYWIRSGQLSPPSTAAEPDDAFVSYPATVSTKGTYEYYDGNQYYNQIINGSWAPYGLCAVSDAGLDCDNGPAYSAPGDPQLDTYVADSIGNIASVDIVFTADQSKWTRCIVLEEEDLPALSEGGALKLNPRSSFSIDQNGNYANASMSAEYTDPTQPNYISDTAMGWFPGYAINLETGERLNMAYGEDSWLSGDNGRDMKWNPDATIFSSGGSTGAGTYFGQTSIFGGKHYIYVFGHNNNDIGGRNVSIPAYDAGQTLHSLYFHEVLNSAASPSKIWWKERVLNDIMWVDIPLLNLGHQLLECDATVRLRVQKPYDTSYGETFLNYANSATSAEDVHSGSTWRNAAPVNNNFPMYSFNTNGLAVTTNSESAAQSALSLINIVPNPYYAYSGYETTALDTRVRITNLPPVCTISIFTLSGTLIDVIQKNSPETYTDWTLMNQYNVPIASGLYLVNVVVPDVGEVTYSKI